MSDLDATLEALRQAVAGADNTRIECPECHAYQDGGSEQGRFSVFVDVTETYRVERDNDGNFWLWDCDVEDSTGHRLCCRNCGHEWVPDNFNWEYR